MSDQKLFKIIRIQSRICIGGPTIHTEILSRYLPASKYESLVIGGALDEKESCRYAELKEKGIRIHIINEMKRDLSPLNDIRTIYALYKIIRKEKPNIVETHTAKAGFTGRIAAFLARVPVIVHTFHGHVFENYFSIFKTKIIILIERFLARLSTKIIVLSRKQLEDIVHKYKIAPADKTEIIPLGFEIERFVNLKRNGSLKHELGISKSRYLIATIGRIVPIKNYEMIFRVIRILQAEHINVHLCVIGDGKLRETYEKKMNGNLNKKYVHFLGWRGDLENIYSSVDLVVITSLNEGTPFSIIEAMASGVPVVATNVGGIPDLIKDGESGFLCEVGNDYEMAKKIKALLLEEDLKSRITHNARQFVFQRYSYKRLINDMEKFYTSLLDSRQLQHNPQ